MKKTFKYNLNYIGGIAEYQKRAIYTLNLKENSFSVDLPLREVSKRG